MKIITSDIEIWTEDIIKDGIPHKAGDFRKAWIYDTDKNKWEFNDLKLYIQKLKSLRECIIYFHHLGFDGLLTFEKLFDIKGCHYSTFNRDYICFYTLKNKRKDWTLRDNMQIRDSYLLLPAKLSKLSESLLGEKMWKEYEELDKLSDKEISDYCLKDCIILKKCILKFMELQNISRKELVINCNTLPSFSYYDWKRFCKKKRIKITDYKIAGKDDQFFRDGYFGGRVEKNKDYSKECDVFDFNSLFPYCMANFEFPKGKYNVVKDVINWDKLGFYDVLIKYPRPNPDLPFTPVRSKEDNVVEYVHGKIRGKFWTETLKNVIKDGGKIIKIIKGFEWEESDNPFKEWVLENYKLRVDNKGTAIDYIIKIKLNSLYGKFGRNNIVTEIYREDKLNMGLGNVTRIGDSLYYKVEIQKEAWQSRVHLASLITNYARNITTELWRDNYNYWLTGDTDSGIFEKGHNIRTSEGLGGLKHEGRYKEGVFLTSKVYCLRDMNNKDIIKAKGFYNKDKLTLNDFKNHLNGIKPLYSENKSPIWGMKETIRKEGVIKLIIGKLPKFRKLVTPYRKRRPYKGKYESKSVKMW